MVSEEEGEVKCKRCGKWLSAPKSVERGYGPVCWEIIHRRYDSPEKFMEAKKRGEINKQTEQLKDSEKEQRTLDEVFAK